MFKSKATEMRTLIQWLQYDRLHNHKLQLDNPTVEKVIEKFSNEDWMKIYSLLRQVYWRYFQTEQEFLTAVENDLAISNNLEELINYLTSTAA